MLIGLPAFAQNVLTEQRRALIEGCHLDYAWSGAVHMLPSSGRAATSPALNCVAAEH
jgi:hypothetical protein